MQQNEDFIRFSILSMPFFYSGIQMKKKQQQKLESKGTIV